MLNKPPIPGPLDRDDRPHGTGTPIASDDAYTQGARVMDIAVIGLGYVGCTNAAGFGRYGHRLHGYDLDPQKVACFGAGQAPFYEPGVNPLLQEALAADRITAKISFVGALRAMDVALVCVGAPSGADGALDLSPVLAVTRDIGQEICHRDPCLGPLQVVYRTTMAPGTVENLLAPALEAIVGEPAGTRYEIVFYPEFLREGAAVQDFINPPRIVIGERSPGASAMIGGLLTALAEESGAPVFCTDYRTSELVKFTDNTWHALKVAFANEVARTALTMGADPAQAAEIFLADTVLNISAKYMRPGPAFGGSCLPKDVRAMAQMTAATGVDTPLIASVMASNDAHQSYLVQRLVERFGAARRILLVGLSFKAATDDLRDSPHVALWSRLKTAGFDVRVYDPEVQPDTLTAAARATVPKESQGVFDALTEDLDAAAAWCEHAVIAKDIADVEAALAYRPVSRIASLTAELADNVYGDVGGGSGSAVDAAE